jgi:rare lipoprotein A
MAADADHRWRVSASLRAGRSVAASVVAPALMAGCALLSGLTFEPVRTDASVPAATILTPSPDRLAAARPSPARHVRARVDLASWYGAWHHGRPTASGEAFDMSALTAAHPSLPLGTCLQVVHVANGRQVFVRVNDRGPYAPGRTIDLSYHAAEVLDMVDDGVARVRLRKVRAAACDAGESGPAET